MSEPSCPSRWSLLILAFAPLAACGYGGDGDYDDRDYDGDPSGGAVFCGDVEEAIIDADQALEVDAGAGAGAFIEYESGGTYRITTSCDAGDGVDCFWDILVTPLDDAPLLGVAPIDLEGDDSVTVGQTNSVRLLAITGTDFDGFTLETDPGAAIRFDALLDEACGNRYLFWVGDGALHSGAPSNPIDLVPSAE